MVLISCPTCGESRLTEENGNYRCSVCGALFTKEEKEDIEAKIEEILARGREADLGKIRFLLRSELAAEHPDNLKIIERCDDILRVLPEDPVALILKAFFRRRINRNEYQLTLSNFEKRLSKYQKDFLYPYVIDLCDLIDAQKVRAFLVEQGDEHLLDRVDAALKNRELETDLFANVERDVFVCHAHADIDRILPLLNRLEKDEGLRLWYSERNMPKDCDNYKNDITNAIEKCKVFLVFASSLAMASKDVQWELDVADRLKKLQRIEYRIENKENNVRFREFFDGIQWIDGSRSDDYVTLATKVFKAAQAISSKSANDLKAAVSSEQRIAANGVNITALLTRAVILLKGGDFKKADELLEQVLNTDPVNSDAYLYKLCVERKAKTIEELSSSDTTFEDNFNFTNAYEFGSDEQKQRLDSINSSISKRLDEQRKERLYQIALDYKKRQQYAEAEKAFSDISGYRDSAMQAAECMELGKHGIYLRACVEMENGNYIPAIQTFEKLGFYKDSKDKIKECEKRFKLDSYRKAIALKKEGKFEQARSMFLELGNFNDSADQARSCDKLRKSGIYNNALAKMKQGQYEESARLFQSISGYQDSKEKAAECEKTAFEMRAEPIYKSNIVDQSRHPREIHDAFKSAVRNLKAISGYKDTDQLIKDYTYILDHYSKWTKEWEAKERKRTAKARRKKTIGILAISGTAVLGISALLLTFLVILPSSSTSKARSLIDQGKYEEAEELLNQASWFGDSQNLLAMSAAGKQFASKNYELGIEYVCKAGGTVDVEFDGAGGTPEVASTTIQKKSRFVEQTAELAGYGFTNWDLTSYTVDAGKHYASLHLKASYEILNYKISYVLDGGQLTNAPNKYTIEDSVAIPNPTKEGYTFVGWTTIDSEQPKKDYSFDSGEIGNKTFTAVWAANDYNFYFDTKGGTLPSDQMGTASGQSYSLPTPVYEGYDFLGWVDENGEAVDMSGVFGWARDVHLSASWSAHGYQIVYNLSGGTTENPTMYTIESSDIVLSDPTREGYTFLGWISSSITQPIKGVTIDSGTTGDLSFTAVWSANTYTVLIDLDGGTAEGSEYEFSFDGEYTLPTPTRTGYGFSGYTLEDGTYVPLSGIWSIPENVTLIANWSADTNTPYVVNHYVESLNGGYELKESENLHGVSDARVMTNAKQYEGFTPRSDTQSIEIHILPDGSSVTDFYYTRNTYHISFVSNGGEPVSQIDALYESNIDLDQVAVRPGYTFEGWYLNPELSEPVPANMPANDIVLYACYKEELKPSSFSYKEIVGGMSVFGFDSKLTSAVIPAYIGGKPVVEIGENAFANNSNLTSVTIPESVMRIQAKAFFFCTSLNTLIGSGGVETIGDSAFCNTAFAIAPDFSSVTSVGTHAFDGCLLLTGIDFNEGLQSIGDYAFYNCASLLVAPNMSNCVSIGANAFEGCVSLSEIKGINASAAIGENILAMCENIGKLFLNFKGAIEQLYISKLFNSSKPSNLVAYYEAETSDGKLYYVPKALKEIEIVGKTANIPAYMLYGISSVSSFTDSTENGITSIGAHAFEFAGGLTDFGWISNVVSIDEAAFKGCANLTALPAMEHLERLGSSAFEDCVSLVSIGSFGSLDSVSDRVFAGCASLSSFDFEHVTGSIGVSAFEGCASLTDASISLGLESIGKNAFAGCVHLKSLSLPYLGDGTGANQNLGYVFGNKQLEGMYSVEDASGTYYVPNSLTALRIVNGTISSLQNLSSLTDLYLGDGVTSISADALKGCGGLKKLRVPFCGRTMSDETPIGVIFGKTEYANSVAVTQNSVSYYFPAALEEIEVANGVIGTNGIARIKTLEKLVLGDGVTFNGTFQFVYLSALYEFVTPYIPNSLSYMFGYNSTIFEGMYRTDLVSGSTYCMLPISLKKVTITGSEPIPAYAFSNAKYIEEIQISDSTPSLGDYAFRGCSGLLRLNSDEDGALSLPSGISSIPQYAFSGCSSAAAVSLPDSVTAIADYAFSGCSSLVRFCSDEPYTLALPSACASVGAYAFKGCSLLRDVDLSAASSVVDRALSGCVSVERLVVSHVPSSSDCGLAYLFDYNVSSAPAGMYQVSNNIYRCFLPDSLARVELVGSSPLPSRAFYGASKVSEIVLSDSIPSIGDRAFYNCTALSRLNGDADGVFSLPSGISSIPQYAFYGCSSAAAVSLPDSVTAIAGYAFSGCSSAAAVSLPDSVSSIGDSAFSGCSSLVLFCSDEPYTLALPSACASVGAYAFKGCSLLRDVDLSAASSVGNHALSGCISVQRLSIACAPTSTVCGMASLFDVGSDLPTGMYQAAYSSSYRYCLPNSLARVELVGSSPLPSRAFYGASKVSEIVLSNSTPSIGEYAFYGCAGLLRLNSDADGVFSLPSGISSIPQYAFSGCSSAAAVSLPDSVSSIGDSAFSGCTSLVRFCSDEPYTLALPSACASVGAYAFKGCSLLRDVDLSAASSVGDRALSGCISVDSLSVPYVPSSSDCGLAYLFDYNVSSAPAGMYQVSNNIYRCFLPDSLARVELVGSSPLPSRAFYGASKVSEIVLSDSTPSIGEYAFYGCAGLLRLNSDEDGLFVLPAATSSIGNYGFSNIANVQEFRMPQTIYSIGNYAFANNANLVRFNSETPYDIQTPYALESIGSYAFSNLPLIRTITITNRVTSIGSSLFYGASALTTLTIPYIPSSNTFGYLFGTSSYTGSVSVKQNGTTYYIPNSLIAVNLTTDSALPDYAFQNIKTITTIHLWEEATSTANSFSNCTAAVYFDLPYATNRSWTGTHVAESYSAGSGTEVNPYIIASAEEYAYFVSQVNSGNDYAGVYFAIGNDMNFNSKPIASALSFSGILDGRGHCFRHFALEGSDQAAFGLIGTLGENGSVHDLHIHYESIALIDDAKLDRYDIGGVVGVNHGTVSNCLVESSNGLSVTVSNLLYMGGVVGNNLGMVSNCYVSSPINATSDIDVAYAGGLVGSNGGALKNSFAAGDVLAHGFTLSRSFAGGAVGINQESGAVENCFRLNTQKVTIFTTVSSTNDLGTSAALSEIVASLKTIWQGKWKFYGSNFSPMLVA